MGQNGDEANLMSTERTNDRTNCQQSELTVGKLSTERTKDGTNCQESELTMGQTVNRAS